MNIFVLDLDPVKCAQMHCNKHVVKMVTETAQILCTVAHELNFKKVPYLPTHRNHPCVKWAMRSKQNYEWLYALGMALYEEYSYRYEKSHSAGQHIKKRIDVNAIAPMLPDIGMTPFALAMPEGFKTNDAVLSYRWYYAIEKRHLLQYKKRNKPDWLV